MDADWRGRVKELFMAARKRRPEERADYLDEACGEDAELRRELESLLIEHGRQSGEGEAEQGAVATSEPAEDPLVGGTLGRYRILSVVGKGGMGTVYEAEDPELRRTVALKVLPPTVARDPKRLERFKREARSVAALSHPNVVTLHSVEEAGDTHFFTMELVPPSRASTSPRSSSDRASWPRVCVPRTSRGSSTVISSPPTSSSTPRAGCASWTSASPPRGWRGRRPRRPRPRSP
jgi:hypothetical protein